MSPSTPFPRRPKWPLVTAGVVVLVVAALLGGWWLGRDQGGDSPDNTTPPTSPTDTTAADGQVDGCLGGPERTPEMVLAAQEQADVASDEDGVAFAASLMRWLVQEPPSSATVDQLAMIAAPNADSSVQEAVEGSASGEGAESATWASTSGARWYIEAMSADELVVSLSLVPLTDGVAAADQRILVTVSLWRGEGVWTWSSFETQVRTAGEMEEIGEPFIGGCG